MAQPIPQVPVTGTAAELAAVRLAKGQLAHATDTGDWYVGDGATLVAAITPQSSGTSVASGWARFDINGDLGPFTAAAGDGLTHVPLIVTSASAENAPVLSVDGTTVVLDPTKAYVVAVTSNFTTAASGQVQVQGEGATGCSTDSDRSGPAGAYQLHASGVSVGQSLVALNIYADAAITDVPGATITVTEV